MNNLSRREFIRCSGGLLGLAFAPAEIMQLAPLPRLSFSTLGCPDWSWNQIQTFAAGNGYQGIEIRGIQRELNLSKTPQFQNKQSILATRDSLRSKNLSLVALGASAGMHYRKQKDRDAAMDEAKRFLDIAEIAGCPYIRVFPDKLPKEFSKESSLETISGNLSALGKHAAGSSVKILMETHGDLLWADDLIKVMNAVTTTEQVALVWDVSNMWSITGESPAEVFNKLKKWILHIHLKDLKKQDGQHQYTFLGDGEVPVMTAVDVLAASGYRGFYSFEWEKLWHPEIADPDIAFTHYARAMRQHFSDRSEK